MNDDVDLLQYAADLKQEVIGRCESGGQIDEDVSLREQEYTRHMIGILTEAGDLSDGDVCYHRARGIRIDGYSVNEDRDCLDLLVSIYTQDILPRTVSREEVETAFRRLTGFFQQSLNGYHRNLEEPSCAFDTALVIYSMRTELRRVRMFLFTDGLTTIERKNNDLLGDVTFSYHIWDLRRTYRCISSGRQREPIEIDFESQYGRAIPCLAMPSGESDYTACLAVVPGDVLYKLYDEYGPRLLERNVRSFLQVRGSVNKGIRDTILIEPHRFFAYNNGISATAEDVEFTTLPDGRLAIRRVRDLQIVNGGQTTASIYQAVNRDRANVEHVYVQMKLSVVDSEQIDEIVPLISRYANSQNKISEADFSANDPFHVVIEELSRRVWAPAVDGTQRQTHWFYERARGQYLDAKARETTAARKRIFAMVNPPEQLFTKTDLAKFENTWVQLPHLVSRGAQKNFGEFTVRLAERGRMDIDEVDFQRLIARAILFRKAERIVQGQRFGGYRANIVTYTLAYLAYRTAQHIDLDRIWREQDLTLALQEAIAAVATHVHGVIVNPPNGGNVTEWCKREDCWKKIQALALSLPDSLLQELVETVPSDVQKPISTFITLDSADSRDITRIQSVPAGTWVQLVSWARETSNLQPWQHGLAHSLGQLAARGRVPSPKQIKHGLKILEQAERLGYAASIGNADVENATAGASDNSE